MTFKERYGPWALVAGASEGLGAAYAHALAQRGLDLLLVARRARLLSELAASLTETTGSQVRCLEGDLSSSEFRDELIAACSEIDLGLVVYNATHAPVGEFVSAQLRDLERSIDVNVRAPVYLLHSLLPQLEQRARGGVILMTSLAGDQGSPRLAAYAASKAYTRILAESLWHETKDRGVDVIACCSGAVRTPGYLEAAGKDAPGTLDPEQVVQRTLRSLGRRPVVIPGVVNRVADIVMARLLPRRTAIGIMARSTADLEASANTPKGD